MKISPLGPWLRPDQVVPLALAKKSAATIEDREDRELVPGDLATLPGWASA